jgi:F0F1-type ATP synthase membrane subunit b/b'
LENIANPNLFPSIGKEVKDEYDRVIGKVAYFGVSPNGQFNTIFIHHNDGRFAKYPLDHVKINEYDVTLLSPVKVRANALCNEIPLIWRKDQALKELSDKGKIPPDMYRELHESFEGVLNQLKSEAQATIEKIDEQINRCTDEIRELNYALVNLEIEHEIGKVEESTYQTAFNIIQECLRRANSEKTDLENLKNKLSNIMLGEEPKPQETVESSETVTTTTVEETSEEAPAPPSSPTLPEPPVIVYVQNPEESEG